MSEGQGTEFEQEAGEAIDFSNTPDDNGFEVLPKGIYDVIVDSAEFKTSSAGNRMFSLQLVITSGDYADRKLFTNITFSEKAMTMAKRSLKMLGANELLEGPFVPSDDTAATLVGKTARAQVTIEKYDGEDTNRVKALKPLIEGGSNGFLDTGN